MNKIRVAFLGSSTEDYIQDTQSLYECLFNVFDEVIVFNGGYQGSMKTVSEIGKKFAEVLNNTTKKSKKRIIVQGILYDGYKHDVGLSVNNVPNTISDSLISSKSIGVRAQSIIDLADIIIALPGKTGTLHEIIQSIETIQYGKNYYEIEDNFKRLFIHVNWKKSIEDLYHNGNMSAKVYNNINQNLFSFESKKDKKKEKIINRLKIIKSLLNENERELEQDDYKLLPIKNYSDSTDPPIEHKIVGLVSKINKVLLGAYYDGEKNQLVGLDIAIKETSSGIVGLSRLDSIGTSEYLRTLNDFLTKYKSIIDNTQSSINKWLTLKNAYSIKIGELFYHDHIKKSQLEGEKDANIENWVEYLERNKLGKSLYWMSVSLHERYHISAFLVLDAYLSDNLKNDVEKVINQFLLEYTLIESAEGYIKNELKNSTKAAISEIINRNMAHHLTSHVSNRATLDKVLERLGKSHTDLNNGVFYATILDLLNRFNQYRDERSEYLSYITNFSSPSTAFLFQDVIRQFIENTLLMDNIAANENINYMIDEETSELLTNKLQLKIKREISPNHYEDFYCNYLSKDKKILYSSENLPYYREKISPYQNDNFEYSYEKCEFNKTNLKDIEISLPGTLGKHALYSILENFIRNSAKHGRSLKNYRLDIILLLSDLDNQDTITVTLTDNCSLIRNKGQLIKINIEEFNKSIETPILKKKDLGLIDMKVNACLLAGMELNDENCKRALKAKEYNGKLAYEFKIAKPKKCVFIGDFTKRETDYDGFYYYVDIEEFVKSKISKSFEFAVLADDLFETNREIISCELPARVLKQSEIDFNKTLNLNYLYEVWLRKLRGEEKANVHIYFEQDKFTSPTEQFLIKYTDNEYKNFIVYSDEKLQELCSIGGKKNVFYDRHGGLITKVNKSFVDINNSWILIDKNNPDFDYISRYDLEKKAELLPLELEEAALLKVLVIDERIAEQSVREIKDANLLKLQPYKYGFTKCEINEPLTLFDCAWAANVFIATHLNSEPLKAEIDLRKRHKLNVSINENIFYETNIASQYGKIVINNDLEAIWEFDDSLNSLQSVKMKEFRPDILILHRTKLKELLEKNENIISTILKNIPNLIITTGSGTSHGIDGNFKILPFASLSETLLGNRIQKLRLSKLLLRLTKNKI